MEGPNPWVVRVVLDDQVPVRLNHLHIAALCVWVSRDLAIPGARTLLHPCQPHNRIRLGMTGRLASASTKKL